MEKKKRKMRMIQLLTGAGVLLDAAGELVELVFLSESFLVEGVATGDKLTLGVASLNRFTGDRTDEICSLRKTKVHSTQKVISDKHFDKIFNFVYYLEVNRLRLDQGLAKRNSCSMVIHLLGTVKAACAILMGMLKSMVLYSLWIKHREKTISQNHHRSI